MNDQYDIFVSYARVDNEPLPSTDKGWVTTLINGLKVFLGKKLGSANAYSLWMDLSELPGNEPVTPNIAQQVENSALFLLILSPGYLASEWCRLELNIFLAKVGKNSGRVFIVELEEMQKPTSLTDLLGYKFWRKDDVGKSRTLATPQPKLEEPEYYQRLDDLARDLSIKIKSLPKPEPKREKVSPILEVTPTFSHSIFLAPVSEDLEKHRDDMKRSLEQEGVRVLPDKDYSIVNIHQFIEQDLSQCNWFVQLLSDKTAHGLPQFQYEQALKMANLPILQWRDKTLDLNDVHNHAHKALLLQPTVMASSLREFQKHVIEQLKPTEKAKMEQSKDILNTPLVFINASIDDMPLAHQIKNFLKTNRIDCSFLPENYAEISVIDRRKYMNQSLQYCDAVIVVYDNAPMIWVNEQVLYSRKQQSKRKKPFKVIAVYKKPATTKLSLPMHISNMQVLECPIPQAESCLPEFIRILSR